MSLSRAQNIFMPANINSIAGFIAFDVGRTLPSTDLSRDFMELVVVGGWERAWDRDFRSAGYASFVVAPDLRRRLELSLTSFHSVAVRFAILCSQRWILVNINASTVTFIGIWGNCPYFFAINEHDFESPWLWDVNPLQQLFWLHLFIYSSSRDR